MWRIAQPRAGAHPCRSPAAGPQCQLRSGGAGDRNPGDELTVVDLLLTEVIVGLGFPPGHFPVLPRLAPWSLLVTAFTRPR